MIVKNSYVIHQWFPTGEDQHKTFTTIKCQNAHEYKMLVNEAYQALSGLLLQDPSMAFSLRILLFGFLLLISLSHAKKSSKPRALVLPIEQDPNTHLYVTRIHKRTPQVPLQFVLDLNGEFLSVNCQHKYLSSTYRAPLCPSSLCAVASNNSCRACYGPPAPGCHNNTCSLVSRNPITRRIAPGELAVDVLSIQSTDGSHPGPLVTIPRFLFACAPAFLLEGPLPPAVHGFAGLGRTQIALPTQLASQFGFPQKFAICLGNKGVLFFGDGPYVLQPGIDVSNGLGYTSLLNNSKGEYFIEVQRIKINNKNVPINTSLLTINQHGIGGAKISTVVPYTILESSIFKAVTEYYAKELSSVPIVPPVAPFGLCFNSKQLGGSHMGPSVPSIELVLEKNNYWKVFGPNAVTRVSDDVFCLAFVDGGEHPVAAITLGAHQMENNLLQFDLASSRLGFSSSLLFRKTSCENFNFASSGK